MSFARSSWSHVEASLEAWARGAAAASREACEATELTRAQPREVLLRRTECLDEQRARFSALLTLLESPDATIVERAPAAAASLPAVAECADSKRLLGPRRVPPAKAGEAAALRRRYLEVATRLNVGAVDGAQAELTEIAGRARALDDRSLEAEVLILRSSLEGDAREPHAALASAREAVLAAEQAHDDRTRAMAWSGRSHWPPSSRKRRLRTRR